MIHQYFTFFLCFCLMSSAKAQSAVGVWSGYLTSEASPYTAGYILDIKSQTSSMIFGKAYVYHKDFPLTEGALDFMGVIDGASFRITELSVLKSIRAPFVQKRSLCIKFLNLVLTRKKKVDQLTGVWAGSTSSAVICDPGFAYLTRITNLQSDSIPTTIKQEMAKNNSSAISFLNTTLSKPIVINVSSRVVTLELSDYMKEDNDTVSVYYNRRLILNKQKIQKKAYSQKLRLDMQSGINEIIVYANNLGKIPPNTSSLIVKDGMNTKRIQIESTLQTSAAIYLRYVPIRYEQKMDIYDYYRQRSVP